MVHSMTGFGEAQAHEDDVTYRVEIRSLNNRYFKATIKLPEQFQHYETEIEKTLRGRLGRGSVMYTLRLRDMNPSGVCDINAAAVAKYVRALQDALDGKSSVQLDLATLLAAPGVCIVPEVDEAILDARFEIVKSLTRDAIDKLVEMRRIEGDALLADLRTQCKGIAERAAMIQKRAPLVIQEYHKRLGVRVRQLLNGAGVELEADTLAREVAVFAERCDVNEELSRLTSHLDQFNTFCDSPDQAGRKLDFLAQEMLREANTIGSKANDSEIAEHVVEIKAAIDRLKEQVQNVE